MTDDRITDIFQKYGQFVTGRERALVRAIAEAVAPQHTWVGLTDEEAHELWESTGSDDDWELMKRTEAKLRSKNENRMG